jgi:hypothetical protein
MRYGVLAVAALLLGCVPARAVDKTAIERSIERGVAALKAMQGPGGWPYVEQGATALAGLTLLECGVPKDDKAVKVAVKVIRDAGLSMTHTYSLALSVLFLDKLDEPIDTPLIESMIVRLLAGQTASGGWSYNCPPLAAEEIRRIRAEMDPSRTLRVGRDLDKLPPKGKRTRDDLPKEVQAQLEVVNRVAAVAADGALSGDNSNTQFATLALWVSRRYGVPTQAALLRVDHRFRASQNADGGWGYTPSSPGGAGAAVFMGRHSGNSTATMTCAGLLGLACGHGSALDVKKAKDDKAGDKKDVSKDGSLKSGLGALSTAIGKPIGWDGVGPRPAAIPPATERAYYFLWSLERVAVILNLETIAKKDWYNWGAEILLANQGPTGAWVLGSYSASGADTCFALLFLKKANLARDLSSRLTGLKGADKLLRVGGVGGAGLRDAPKGGLAPTGIGGKAKAPAAGAPREAARGGGRPAPETPRPAPRRTEDGGVARLGDDLVRATGAGRLAILKKLRDSRGVAYTETLVWAIAKMDGEGRREARVALAERLSRMKDTTLREYLKDDEAEIRRAAALAAAARGSKVLVPDLIGRLADDPEELVRRAAHAALKELTRKDYGPAPGAGAAERQEAVAAWRKWWKENARE